MPGPYRLISTETDEGILVLTIDVDQVRDYALAEDLRFEMVHAVKGAKSRLFVLDLGKMTFMTSLACVAFIGLKHAVREVDGRLVLCNMSEFLEKVFQAKRLLSPSQHTGNVAFECMDSLDEAKAYLRQSTE